MSKPSKNGDTTRSDSFVFSFSRARTRLLRVVAVVQGIQKRIAGAAPSLVRFKSTRQPPRYPIFLLMMIIMVRRVAHGSWWMLAATMALLGAVVMPLCRMTRVVAYVQSDAAMPPSSFSSFHWHGTRPKNATTTTTTTTTIVTTFTTSISHSAGKSNHRILPGTDGSAAGRHRPRALTLDEFQRRMSTTTLPPLNNNSSSSSSSSVIKVALRNKGNKVVALTGSQAYPEDITYQMVGDVSLNFTTTTTSTPQPLVSQDVVVPVNVLGTTRYLLMQLNVTSGGTLTATYVHDVELAKPLSRHHRQLKKEKSSTRKKSRHPSHERLNRKSQRHQKTQAISNHPKHHPSSQLKSPKRAKRQHQQQPSSAVKSKAPKKKHQAPTASPTSTNVPGGGGGLATSPHSCLNVITPLCSLCSLSNATQCAKNAFHANCQLSTVTSKPHILQKFNDIRTQTCDCLHALKQMCPCRKVKLSRCVQHNLQKCNLQIGSTILRKQQETYVQQQYRDYVKQICPTSQCLLLLKRKCKCGDTICVKRYQSSHCQLSSGSLGNKQHRHIKLQYIKYMKKNCKSNYLLESIKQQCPCTKPNRNECLKKAVASVHFANERIGQRHIQKVMQRYQAYLQTPACAKALIPTVVPTSLPTIAPTTHPSKRISRKPKAVKRTPSPTKLPLPTEASSPPPTVSTTTPPGISNNALEPVVVVVVLMMNPSRSGPGTTSHPNLSPTVRPVGPPVIQPRLFRTNETVTRGGSLGGPTTTGYWNVSVAKKNETTAASKDNAATKRKIVHDKGGIFYRDRAGKIVFHSSNRHLTSDTVRYFVIPFEVLGATTNLLFQIVYYPDRTVQVTYMGEVMLSAGKRARSLQRRPVSFNDSSLRELQPTAAVKTCLNKVKEDCLCTDPNREECISSVIHSKCKISLGPVQRRELIEESYFQNRCHCIDLVRQHCSCNMSQGCVTQAIQNCNMTSSESENDTRILSMQYLSKYCKDSSPKDHNCKCLSKYTHDSFSRGEYHQDMRDRFHFPLELMTKQCPCHATSFRRCVLNALKSFDISKGNSGEREKDEIRELYRAYSDRVCPTSRQLSEQIQEVSKQGPELFHSASDHAVASKPLTGHAEIGSSNPPVIIALLLVSEMAASTKPTSLAAESPSLVPSKTLTTKLPSFVPGTYSPTDRPKRSRPASPPSNQLSAHFQAPRPASTTQDLTTTRSTLKPIKRLRNMNP